MAVTRATCLYCGAPLPAAVVVAAAPAAREAPPVDDPRTLVAADLGGADVDRVARALGLLAYDAAQRVRRPGWQLLRVGAPLEGDAASELRAAGARLVELPAAEARAGQVPEAVIGGAWRDGRLHLRLEDGATQVAPGELLLVVQGEITREIGGAAEPRRRISSAVPEAGRRLHLHRHDGPRPLEIDPQDFEFGHDARPPGPPLALLLGWCAELRPSAGLDDGFRHVTPALAPSQPGPRSAAVALGRGAERPRAKTPERLDNLEQFRFHSAWRAAVERRLARGDGGRPAA